MVRARQTWCDELTETRSERRCVDHSPCVDIEHRAAQTSPAWQQGPPWQPIIYTSQRWPRPSHNHAHFRPYDRRTCTQCSAHLFKQVCVEHILRRLSTQRYPHLLLSAGACSYRSMSAANPPAAVAGVDRWEGRTPDRYILSPCLCSELWHAHVIQILT